ncbi:MAG: hypothetical protein ACD_75C02463G0003 [uncultured bacterium]|nr:MAG: hypothetical protein ACD_75C02463G0003 [uncultured bacterium]
MGIGDQPDNIGLYKIGVLVFVDHDVGKTLRDGSPYIRRFSQQPLPVHQQIVVVHQAVVELEFLVMLVQEEKVLQMFGEMGILILNQLLQADRFVDRTADHVDHYPFRGEAFVLFAKSQG